MFSKRLFGIIIAFLVATSFSITGCKKKKKKTIKKTQPESKAQKCNCPKVKVCASKEALSRKKERCLKWQTAEAKKENRKAPELTKIELYITKVNPIGVIKYYRTDRSLACREVDLNGDGLMDLFYFYDLSGRIKKEIQEDNDRDGIIDLKLIYKNDVIFKEYRNSDGDESTWEMEKTYNNGVITQIAATIINPSGSLERVCSKYNYFENFDTKGHLISISWDIDCDGDMDRVRNKDGKFESDAYKNLKLDKKAKVSKLKEEDTSIVP